MKTSSAKSKGRNLQKYVARIVAAVLNLEPDDVVSRPMGSSGTDLMMSPKAQKRFPISIECKNTKSFPSLAALKQSEANKYKNTIAAVTWKPHGKSIEETIIYFNFVEFVELWATTRGLNAN